MELPSRRKIPAVYRNLSLNSCFVLLRVKSTYSLTVACIGLGGGGPWIQWCRSLLNIGGGGVICNFTPNLPYFQHWGEWTSTTILFRCGNLVKTKRKMQTDHFFSPNSGEDHEKKKVFSKNRTLFLPDFRWRPKKKMSSAREEHFFPQIYAQLYTLSNYWVGCRSEPFSNYEGGYSQIIEGDISPPSPPPPHPPPPPRVSAPLIESLLLARQHIFHSHNVVKKTTTLFCCKQCRRQSNRSEGALAESEGALAESEGVLKSTELLHIKTDILRLQILTILLSWLKNRRIRPAVFLSLFRIRPI